MVHHYGSWSWCIIMLTVYDHGYSISLCLQYMIMVTAYHYGTGNGTVEEFPQTGHPC